ncbi:MAG: hypothetical protein Q9223_005961 [Gallowayella weberi]
MDRSRPDNCDGTYEQYCDQSRQYTNISSIISAAGQTDLLNYMNAYWKDYQGDDESFWEHEWGKHGTCISTLEPGCYDNYTPQQEVVAYFQKTVDLFKTLDSYAILSAAGIVPSSTKTYTSSQILAALAAPRGVQVSIQCRNGEIDEIWYFFDVQGSVQTGTFVPAEPDGSKSNCPATGIKYLPKTGTPPSSTLVTSTGTQPTSTPTPGNPFSGKGTLPVTSGGKTNGCIISGGTWYTTGTCASFTAAASGSGFTLTSSKGKCAVANNVLTCGTSVTASTVFTSVNGKLAYNAIRYQSVATRKTMVGTIDTWPKRRHSLGEIAITDLKTLLNDCRDQSHVSLLLLLHEYIVSLVLDVPESVSADPIASLPSLSASPLSSSQS